MNDISVIIPTYKRSDKLENAIASVLMQTLPANEIIVVDDNRDEAEIMAVENCVRSFGDPRLVRIQNFRNPGGCGARNSGVMTAKGEFIAFLDDDDIFFPNALETHLRNFNSSIDMVYGNCQVVDDLYNVTETTAFGRSPLSFSDLIMGDCPPSSSVVMVRRAALLNAGLFDETLPSFQDYDMWLKIARAHSIVSHDGLVAKFIQHDGQRTSINFDRRRKGLELIVAKWSSDIEKVRSLKSFVDHFMAGAYFNSGAVALTLGARYRAEAVGYFLRALRLKYSSRRYWKWTVFSLLGFQLTKKIRSIHP
jgi:glycosyltransferase involved in cell wall biosynthesis